MGQQPSGGPPLSPLHPLLACAEAIEAALKDAAGVDPGFMRTGEKAEALRRLDRLESRLTVLRLRVMANADEVATRVTGPVSWHWPGRWSGGGPGWRPLSPTGRCT